MNKIIAICGKICSGKSYYANILKDRESAIILSCDEITKILFDNNLGDKHDEMSKRIWDYLLLKASQIVNNVNVILDWGFWSKSDRKYIDNYFTSQGISVEWHYVDIDDLTWKINIKERNDKVLLGEGGNDYYLDQGLLLKLLSKWETPESDEIDVYYKVKR